MKVNFESNMKGMNALYIDGIAHYLTDKECDFLGNKFKNNGFVEA